MLQPPKPSTRPSPKRICGCVPVSGSSSTTSQRVPTNGLGGGSFSAVAHAQSRNSEAMIVHGFMHPPNGASRKCSRLLRERLEVGEPELEVRAREVIDHEHEVMAQRIASDIALARPGHARRAARGLEAECALEFHAVVGKEERVLDQAIVLDTRKFHHSAAFGLTHPRPLSALTERRA